MRSPMQTPMTRRRGPGRRKRARGDWSSLYFEDMSIVDAGGDDDDGRRMSVSESSEKRELLEVEDGNPRIRILIDI